MGQKPIHPSELLFDEGVFLVKLARKAVEYYFDSGGKILEPPEDTPEKLKRPGMCFTTIETYKGEELRSLRGCIGFLAPIQPLVEAVIKSAVEAAFNDPRFPPLARNELSQVTFEVSILSAPEPIVVENRWDLPKKIIIGKHGLVVKKGFFQGTLLPQVPIEYCWDEETFLAETCIKAGLTPDCWLHEDTEVLAYEGRVFREKKPYGDVEEFDLSKEYERLCRRKLG